MLSRRNQRISMNNSFSKFVNTILDPLLIEYMDNTSTELAEAENKIEGDGLKQKQMGKEVESNVDGKSKTGGKQSSRKKKKTVKDIQGSKTVMKGGSMTKNQMVRGKNNVNRKTKTDVGKSTKRKKKTNEDSENVKNNKRRKVTKEWHGIRTRCSPHQLFRAVSGMKNKQREAVKRMGFGKLLTFKVDGIPSKLGHYVVDMLDTTRMEINLGTNQIKIDKAAIHQLLGLPNTGINLTSIQKPKESDPICSMWKERNGKRLVGAKEIADRIIGSNDEDGMMFKIDFVVLFFSTMIQCHKNGLCRQSIIDYKTIDNDFGDFDWCSYVVDAIRNCKKGWRRGDISSDFNGPLAILTLLYVDNMTCPGLNIERTLRPITFWTLENLRRREAEELKNGGFGLGQFRGLFVDEKQHTDGDDRDNENCDESEYLFQPMDLTGYLAKLESLYEQSLKAKVTFEKALGEAKRLFPHDFEVGDLVEKYRSIYVDSMDFAETVVDKSQPNVEITSADTGSKGMTEDKFQPNVETTSADTGSKGMTKDISQPNVEIISADTGSKGMTEDKSQPNVEITSADTGSKGMTEDKSQPNAEITSADTGSKGMTEDKSRPNVEITSADTGSKCMTEDKSQPNVEITYVG